MNKIILLILFACSFNVHGIDLYMDSLQSNSGSQISMPVYVNGFTDITSMQGSITFDASVLSYLDISNFNLPGLTISNFGTTQTGQGVLTYSWYDASLQGVSVSDSTQLFSIDFLVIGSSGQSSNISFSNSPTVLEVVDNNFNILSPFYTDGVFMVDYISPIEEISVEISLYPNIISRYQEVLINNLSNLDRIVVLNISGKIINSYYFQNNIIKFYNSGWFFISVNGKIFKCLVI